MRIAIDARPLSGPICGIRRYTESLIRQFTQLGHECYLYSPSPIISDVSEIGNVTVRCGKLRIRSALAALFSMTWFSIWVSRDRPDAYWSPRHQLPFYIPSNISRVVTLHDVVWKHLPHTMDWRTRLLEQCFTYPSLSRASAIICVSNHTRDSVSQFWPKLGSKCTVVYSGGSSSNENAVSPNSPHTPLDGNQGYLLFVGTDEPRKNLDRLLAAYSILIAQKHANVGLILVANNGWGGSDISSILSEQYPGLESIKLLRNVTDEELSLLYQSAICLLIPSLSEGFGLPAVEAMQHGTPVIAADRGALPEVVGSAGIYCDPESTESLLKAMTKMLDDSTLQRKLGTEALKRGKTFSWSSCARNTLTIFAQG